MLSGLIQLCQENQFTWTSSAKTHFQSCNTGKKTKILSFKNCLVTGTIFILDRYNFFYRKKHVRPDKKIKIRTFLHKNWQNKIYFDQQFEKIIMFLALFSSLHEIAHFWIRFFCIFSKYSIVLSDRNVARYGTK